MAFAAGATAAVGSSVVKVPLAVCVRSVQAGLYRNPVAAARSLVETAGLRSLFTVTHMLGFFKVFNRVSGSGLGLRVFATTSAAGAGPCSVPSPCAALRTARVRHS